MVMSREGAKGAGAILVDRAGPAGVIRLHCLDRVPRDLQEAATFPGIARLGVDQGGELARYQLRIVAGTMPVIRARRAPVCTVFGAAVTEFNEDPEGGRRQVGAGSCRRRGLELIELLVCHDISYGRDIEKGGYVSERGTRVRRELLHLAIGRGRQAAQARAQDLPGHPLRPPGFGGRAFSSA